jgi:hypothetical protein
MAKGQAVRVSAVLPVDPPITADEIALLRTYLHQVIDNALGDET